MTLAAAWVACAALSASACGGKSERAATTAEAGRDVVAGASSGGAPATSAGGTATATSGGTTHSCLDVDGRLSYERRICVHAEDCTTLQVKGCCGADRILGIAAEQRCDPLAVDCPALDCAERPGFLLDDGSVVERLADVDLHCQFGEPGAGLCRTRLRGSDAEQPAVCGAGTCAPGELCVHPAARGGATLAPFCAAIPPGCGAPVACACLPSELCGDGEVACRSTQGVQVYCDALSP